MAESSCSKSTAQKNSVLSFSLNEDSDDDVKIIPDIIGEDELLICLAVTMLFKTLKALRRN